MRILNHQPSFSVCWMHKWSAFLFGGCEGTQKDFLKWIEFWQPHKRVCSGMSTVHTVLYFPWQRHKSEVSHLLAFDQLDIVVLTWQTPEQPVC